MSTPALFEEDQNTTFSLQLSRVYERLGYYHRPQMTPSSCSSASLTDFINVMRLQQGKRPIHERDVRQKISSKWMQRTNERGQGLSLIELESLSDKACQHFVPGALRYKAQGGEL